jgi:hypothetical protein
MTLRRNQARGNDDPRGDGVIEVIPEGIGSSVRTNRFTFEARGFLPDLVKQTGRSLETPVVPADRYAGSGRVISWNSPNRVHVLFFAVCGPA